MAVVVGASSAGGDVLADDPFRAGAGQQELVESLEGPAESGKLAVTPGLLADPGDGIEAILPLPPAFIHLQQGQALGAEAAPGTLDDDGNPQIANLAQG